MADPKFEDLGSSEWDSLSDEERAYIEAELDKAGRGMDQEFPFAHPIKLGPALEYLAMCVARHGDEYLPLYEKVEAAYEAEKARNATKDRARALAAKPR